MQKSQQLKNTHLYLRYNSTIGLYRLKCNNEHDYPKTQVTNQQIKAQAVPPFCVFFSKLLLKLKQTNTYKHHKHMKLTKTNNMHDKNTDYLNMNNH